MPHSKYILKKLNQSRLWGKIIGDNHSLTYDSTNILSSPANLGQYQILSKGSLYRIEFATMDDEIGCRIVYYDSLLAPLYGKGRVFDLTLSTQETKFVLHNDKRIRKLFKKIFPKNIIF